jgi:hypothetical protein
LPAPTNPTRIVRSSMARHGNTTASRLEVSDEDHARDDPRVEHARRQPGGDRPRVLGPARQGAWTDPVAHDDYAGLAPVADAPTTAIAAGEYQYGIVPFRHCSRRARSTSASPSIRPR